MPDTRDEHQLPVVARRCEQINVGLRRPGALVDAEDVDVRTFGECVVKAELAHMPFRPAVHAAIVAVAVDIGGPQRQCGHQVVADVDVVVVQPQARAILVAVPGRGHHRIDASRAKTVAGRKSTHALPRNADGSRQRAGVEQDKGCAGIVVGHRTPCVVAGGKAGVVQLHIGCSHLQRTARVRGAKAVCAVVRCAA
ncbi:hypothetical protein D3C81_1262510 [compost metagenome]